MKKATEVSASAQVALADVVNGMSYLRDRAAVPCGACGLPGLHLLRSGDPDIDRLANVSSGYEAARRATLRRSDSRSAALSVVSIARAQAADASSKRPARSSRSARAVCRGA
jgi:hypothetical protein